MLLNSDQNHSHRLIGSYLAQAHTPYFGTVLYCLYRSIFKCLIKNLASISIIQKVPHSKYPNDISNYRVISKLSSISKLFLVKEKIKIANSVNILNQHWFISNSITVSLHFSAKA